MRSLSETKPVNDIAGLLSDYHLVYILFAACIVLMVIALIFIVSWALSAPTKRPEQETSSEDENLKSNKKSNNFSGLLIFVAIITFIATNIMNIFVLSPLFNETSENIEKYVSTTLHEKYDFEKISVISKKDSPIKDTFKEGALWRVTLDDDTQFDAKVIGNTDKNELDFVDLTDSQLEKIQK